MLNWRKRLRLPRHLINKEKIIEGTQYIGFNSYRATIQHLKFMRCGATAQTEAALGRVAPLYLEFYPDFSIFRGCNGVTH